MFSVDEWIEILICLHESIEREQKRMDSTEFESLKAQSRKRIDDLVDYKRRIRAIIGKGK